MSTVTLLLHGAGSCPETALRLLAPLVPPGSSAEAIDARGSAELVCARLASIVEAYERAGVVVARVAGISLGAHAAAMWAAGRTESAGRSSQVELALVMPAWTGDPGVVATATLATADEVAQRGSDAVLARLDADPALVGDWVLDELRRGWSTYDDDALVAALRAAGASPSATLEQLGTIGLPTAVVALADDPLHPESVAQSWATALPFSTLQVVGRDAPSRDPGALGAAAARAFAELSGSR